MSSNPREVAGIRLLPPPSQNMNQLRRQDAGAPRRLLSMYLPSGDLHRLAAMDYILGNTDSHSGNVMVLGDRITLIDHGSAFAGPSFNPAHDPKTYVPFYLRIMAPGNWKELTPGQRYAALPRLHPSGAAALGTWLQGLSEDHISTAVSRYGIDPAPVVARLKSLKDQAAHMPADLAINASWTL
jgi:Phosphatidylinositol 3- and 4-kinase